MPSPPSEPPSGIILDEWLLKGPKKLTIDDETNFVEPNILRGVLESKVYIKINHYSLRLLTKCNAILVSMVVFSCKRIKIVSQCTQKI